MSWKKVSEHVDVELGYHIAKLKNHATGQEHIVQIAIGHEACPHCGGAKAKAGLSEFVPQDQIATVIEELNRSHTDIQEYARRHGLRTSK
jgi:uncharacterized protein (UPF0212 family)